jgi:hypothetical protein
MRKLAIRSVLLWRPRERDSAVEFTSDAGRLRVKTLGSLCSNLRASVRQIGAPACLAERRAKANERQDHRHVLHGRMGAPAEWAPDTTLLEMR